MATWQDLENELNAWDERGEIATFWWRDDDAGKATPSLDRLIGISEKHTVPLHFAVIPQALEKSAIDRINTSPDVWVMQHGYSHIDYAPQGHGCWELGDDRPLPQVLEELSRGFKILSDAFGDKFLPVQVPPWTRISPEVADHLKLIGFKALSQEGERAGAAYADKIKIINPHCDPIKWKGGARFKGTSRTLNCLVSHLKNRRSNNGDLLEITGLCTHHLDHSDELWDFLDDFTRFIANHKQAKWLSLNDELDERI